MSTEETEQKDVQVEEEQGDSESVLEQIDDRLASLASAEKALGKRSTISFVERRDLSTKASKAAAGLRAQRAEAEGAAAGAEPSEVVKAALKEADRVLDLVQAAQPAGFSRRSSAGGSKIPGAGRRMGGMNSQQRPPDRVGE
jgi:hypothetical protein